MASVFVIDDRRLVREGLKCVLSCLEFRVVAEAGSFADALQALQEMAGTIDLLLGSLGTDPVRNLEAVKTIRRQFPELKVAVLGDVLIQPWPEVTLASGASGFLSVDISKEVLRRDLGRVLSGERIVHAAAPSAIYTTSRPDFCEMAASVKVLQTASNDRLDERNPSVPQNLRSVANSRDSATTNDLLQTLSGRERQILDCLVLGMSNKLIARQLSMAEATVKVHLKALLRKLQAKNRTQAAILAVRSREAARASTAEVISASPVPMPELLASRRPSRPSASLPSINWGFPNISASIARRP